MKPRPSCYNNTLLKKLVICLKVFSFFAFNWVAARKKNIIAVWAALLKLDGSCGIWKMGCVGFGEQAVACHARVTDCCLPQKVL